MPSIYRDPDPSALTAFANHVTIAETLYGAHLDLGVRLAHEWDSELQQDYLMTWVQLWDQLEEARRIATQLGRDVTTVDAAERRANPYAVDAAITEAHRDATRTAFVEVRRCMPEIVVPSSVQPARPRRAPRRVSPHAWGALGSLLALLVFLARC